MKLLLKPMAALGLLALLVAVYWAFVYGAHALGYGCFSKRCFSEALDHGPLLFMGALLLALFGHSLINRPSKLAHERAPLRPFTAMAAGLTALVVYVYLRSLFNHLVVDIPVSRVEILGLIGLSVGVGWLRERVRPQGANSYTPYQFKRLALDLVLLLAICMLLADREMPREIMLSTDPDSHAFYATQVQRFGGVPYHQGPWGDQGLNYPAGSGVVLYLWSLVSFIDIRSLITAMPMLLSWIAALIMVEVALRNVPSTSHRLIAQFTALALIGSAWMFPIYPPFAHMEGTGRQLSIVFVALFMSYATSGLSGWSKENGLGIWLAACLLMLLTLLNPANIVIPGGLLFAMFVHRWVSGRSPMEPAVVLLLGLGLLFLDPYFQNMLGIVQHARTDTVAYNDALVIKTLPQIWEGALRVWTEDFWKSWREMSVMLFEQKTPHFLAFLVLFTICLIIVRRGVHWTLAGWMALVAFLASVYLVYSFSQSLVNDRRFYLLGPYVFFSMSHYKALLLVFLVASILAGLAAERVHRLLVVLVALACFWPVHHVVRHQQEMMPDPRKLYCGALGCIADEDQRLLERLELIAQQGGFRDATGRIAKTLIPNIPTQIGPEGWIFPATSGRLFPYYDISPAAFYYYQGDVEYGTRSYQQRVCDQLDRQWLMAKGIQYIFVPSQRDEVCVAGLENLIRTEEVIAQEGNAYMLKLREVR